MIRGIPLKILYLCGLLAVSSLAVTAQDVDTQKAMLRDTVIEADNDKEGKKSPT
jgi:hypothetical protein